MTLYVLVLLVGGWFAIVGGLALVVHVIRSARKRPVRRPEPGLGSTAGRVYKSRAAGVAPARDRGRVAAPPAAVVATLPLDHPAWTVPVSQHVQVRAGRHRVPAGVSR